MNWIDHKEEKEERERTREKERDKASFISWEPKKLSLLVIIKKLERD